MSSGQEHRVFLRFFRNLYLILRQLAIWLFLVLRWIAVKVVPRLWATLRGFARWVAASRFRRRVVFILTAAGLVAAVIYVLLNPPTVRTLTSIAFTPRDEGFARWFTGTEQDRAALVTTAVEPCPEAPFLLPTEGFIGLLYADPRLPYTELQRHQGIDIFTLGNPGSAPVYAAYDGYISRNEYWTSAVIERVPDDPLHPGRQIWLYYTHMAPANGLTDYILDTFPPGVEEVYVTRGTLIGYTGNYSGTARGISTHLHFSVVLDDGFGGYRNELYFDNTVDPSLYLGMAVNYACAPLVPSCTPNPLCAEAILSAGGS